MNPTPFVWRAIVAILVVLALGVLRYRALATAVNTRYGGQPREHLTVGFLPVT